jgi:hypothetical protein
LEPSEAALIFKACHDVIKGESLQSIVRDWNDAGVRTSRGNEWDNKSLKRVLTRWRNAGYVQHNDEPVQAAVWPAIGTEQGSLTVDDIRAVRRVLGAAERRTSPGPTPKHLLTNIARCGVCGGPMIARRGTTTVNKEPVKVGVYQCKKAGCWTTIRREWLDERVSEDAALYFSLVDMTEAAPSTEDRERLTTLRDERAEILAEQEQIGARVGSGEWSVAVADVAMRAFKERLDNITRELEVIEQRFTFAAMLGETALVTPNTGDWDKALDIRERWESLSLERRRKILRDLSLVIVMPGRKIEDRIVIRRYPANEDGSPVPEEEWPDSMRPWALSA